MDGSERASSSRASAIAFPISVIAAAVVAALAILGHLPPRPRPANSPPSEFSAARAREVLQRLYAGSPPHVVGTAASARMRKRVAEELARIGCEPTVQERFVCGRDGTCARVANVLTHIPGTAPGKAVLLAAHYDSVGAGPGASDDGMGVASLLEVARIVKSEPPRRNSVIVLIDDGEEAGLLGAEAFAASHPWAREVGAVVNIEARGTSGASLLFETSDDNRWLIALAAGALPHPNTSSVFYTIYKWLPNDTDLTVFREHGLPGVNFACIGDVAHYHTPLDSFENASPSTLQHHGENALAMTRALAETDLDAQRKSKGNAVFFDLFGLAIASWRDQATPPSAAAALLLVVVFGLRRLRRQGASAREAVWGLAGSLAMLLGAPAVCLVAVALLKAAGALPTQWAAHPQWLMAALWLASFSMTWFLALPFVRRARGSGFWTGLWLLWAGAALALALASPGLSYVFLVPALIAAVLGWSDSWWATSVPAVAASFFWLPMAWFLYDGLGVKGSVLIAVMVALPAGTLAPAFSQLAVRSRRAVLCVLAACATGALAGAALAPPFSADSPQRLPLGWHEDADSGQARWLAAPDSGILPQALKAAGPFAAHSIAPFPWSREVKTFAASAESRKLPAPQWQTLGDAYGSGGRRLRARVWSPRGAPIIFLAFPPPSRPASIRVGGQLLPELYARAAKAMGDWRIISDLTVPPEGVEVELAYPGRGPIDLFVGDETLSLPEGGERLAAARLSTAVTSQWGDVSFVTRRLRFE